jgi:hypothetical protein
MKTLFPAFNIVLGPRKGDITRHTAFRSVVLWHHSAFVALGIVIGLAAFTRPAHAEYTETRTFHYACKSADKHYALTVNTKQGVVKLQDYGPPFTHSTFRIVKDVMPGCGKDGWKLSNDAVICTATQGYAELTWHGHEFVCDQADTE